MATKTLKSRIKMKRDTSANWTKNNPVLLNGEIIIVDTEAGETRYKIGDGTKKYLQLPFQDEVVRGLINDKQDKITASGILKSNGSGNITAATANTDYLPVTNPVLKGNPTAPTPTTDTSIANKKYVDDSFSDSGFAKGTMELEDGTDSVFYKKSVNIADNNTCYIQVGGNPNEYEDRIMNTGIWLRREELVNEGLNYTQLMMTGNYSALSYVSEGDNYSSSDISMNYGSISLETDNTVYGSTTVNNNSSLNIKPKAISIKTPSLNFANVAATTGCPTPTADTSIANKKYVDTGLDNIVQVRTVSLPTSSWTENDGYYSQKFVFAGSSSNSKVDFQVDSTAYSILKNSGVYLLQPVNNNGLFYAYAYGGKPNADLTIQISFMGAQAI